MPRQNNNNNNNNNGDNSSSSVQLTGIAPSTTSNGYFQGAPLTKLGAMVWVLSQFILKSSNSNNNNTTAHGRISTGQIIFAGLFLVPLLRKLEREMGSTQYFLWMASAVTMSVGLLQVLQILIGEYYWQSIIGGGGGDNNNNNRSNTATNTASSSSSSSSLNLANFHMILIGAVLYWYVQYVPRLYPRFVSVLGIALSEKALYGGWGLYVLLAGGWESIIMATLGAISSAVVVSSMVNKLWAMPSWVLAENGTIHRTFDSLGGLLLLDPPTKIYAPLMMATMNNNNNNNNGMRGARNNAAAAAARAPMRRAPTPPPPQAAVDQLTAMGFEESQVRQALRQSGNNVERAADRLLTG